MFIDNYSTKDEAIREGIVAPIESGDASADEFNLDAIFSKVFEFDPESQRFYNTVSAEEFWQIVEDNAI